MQISDSKLLLPQMQICTVTTLAWLPCASSSESSSRNKTSLLLSRPERIITSLDTEFDLVILESILLSSRLPKEAARAHPGLQQSASVFKSQVQLENEGIFFSLV